jgi:hypothetical protein
MKIVYKPFALIFSVLGARVGNSVFKSLWGRIDRAEPPKPTTARTSLSKAVGAAALEAATMATVSAVADRAAARTFEHLTGVWPGEPPEDEKKRKKKEKKEKK